MYTYYYTNKLSFYRFMHAFAFCVFLLEQDLTVWFTRSSAHIIWNISMSPKATLQKFSNVK